MIAIISRVRRKYQGHPARARSRARFLVAAIVAQFVRLALLGITYRTGFWTASSVGISEEVAPPVALAVGFGEYFLLAWACSAFAVGVGAMQAYSKASLRANARFVPSSRTQGFLVFGVLGLVNPLTEELLFRGLLVYQFHSIGAPLWLAVGLGAVVNSINHAYQGRVLAPFHLAFYASAVALAFSPLGLCGAIGMHFAADIVPWVSYRKHLRHYRAMRRQIRRAKPAK